MSPLFSKLSETDKVLTVDNYLIEHHLKMAGLSLKSIFADSIFFNTHKQVNANTFSLQNSKWQKLTNTKKYLYAVPYVM